MFELGIAHASIDKPALHARYNGQADGNAYRLALQFLLEKIDAWGSVNRILVADEAKEEQLRALKRGAGCSSGVAVRFRGGRLTTIIDSLHFVRSNASPGVQLADLVAYVIQRARPNREHHPNAVAAMDRLDSVVRRRTLTWREPWPAWEASPPVAVIQPRRTELPALGSLECLATRSGELNDVSAGQRS